MFEFNQNPEEAAENLSCNVVYPAPNELQIDIDSADAYITFEKRVELFRTAKELKHFQFSIIEKPSKSGLPRRHITLKCNRNFNHFERIALQVAFGSDPVREGLSALRAISGEDDPCRFFELKTKKLKEKQNEF